MKKKSSNRIIIVLMGIIIIILSVLCVLFATEKLEFKSESNLNATTKEKNTNSKTEKNDSKEQKDNQVEGKKNYSNYIGTWRDNETQDEITIKNITDNEITFTWSLYRLISIDDAKVPFKDGKGIFFFQGYDDKNYDDNDKEDEKYMRKATIDLTNDGVNVIVEDVNKIDANSKILDIDGYGAVHIKAGTYTYKSKS